MKYIHMFELVLLDLFLINLKMKSFYFQLSPRTFDLVIKFLIFSIEVNLKRKFLHTFLTMSALSKTVYNFNPSNRRAHPNLVMRHAYLQKPMC